ncbi:uncharacterized protein CMC5_036770 [Chondromyces crocatus]|uniref:Uncharacterized protein n=2 Tax=Chondromyces crocatus TaxID=52 RepID=A0A0K1EF84_CHOCO|nr:uncharacterized protein CMC5_036770 [Chondromyces crocatus]
MKGGTSKGGSAKDEPAKGGSAASGASKGGRPKLTFGDAVTTVPALAGVLEAGKQALKKDHRKQVTCDDETRWTGSIDLDAALMQHPQHASQNRWDYGMGYLDPAGKESAIWIEVHSAETGEVSTVIRKLAWLKAYLPEHCPDLWTLTHASREELRFVWIASGRYAIPKHMPQMRMLRAAGLDPPVQRLHLP